MSARENYTSKTELSIRPAFNPKDLKKQKTKRA